MVKKSRRQRDGTGRVNPYNVVGQEISGENTDFVETSVACDEYSSTMFQPETSKKRSGILRLKKKTSQYKSSQVGDPGQSESPAMHAVANGERMEAFSTSNNGVDDPAEGGEGYAEKKVAYSKPCPKSKKSSMAKNKTLRDDENTPKDEDIVEKEDIEENKDIVEEENIVEEDIVEEDIIEEDVIEENMVEEEKVDLVEEEKEDVVEEEKEDRVQEPINGHDNEGIVTEPEDQTDPESANVTDADVTISFLEPAEEPSDVDEVEEGSTTSLQGVDEPIIEFPTDSPEKPSKLEVIDEASGSDVDEGVEPGLVVDEGESLSEPEDDVANDSEDRGFKILHRLRNPTLYTDRQTEPEYAGEATERLADFSFGRSLRSLSGRRTLKTGQPDESIMLPTGPSFFNFGFGKRKAEECEEATPKEREPKRARTEEGQDSLGFFARLTSPVINRLRGIKVATSSQEVNGHEEMAVALVAPPASKRCILM